MARPGSVMFASSHTRAGPPHSYRSPTRGSSREPGHALLPRPPLCPLLLWRRDEAARLFDPLLLGGRVRLLVFGQRDRLQLAALLDGHHLFTARGVKRRCSQLAVLLDAHRLLTLEVPCRDAVLGDAPPEGGTAAAARESPTFATQTCGDGDGEGRRVRARALRADIALCRTRVGRARRGAPLFASRI